MTENNPFTALSDAMAEAVTKAGAATVLVDARRRMPASGIVFEPGLILTANHVIEREADLRVLFNNGSEAGVHLVGRDQALDLAVLQLAQAAPDLAEPAAEMARVGQLVLALGRPTPDGIEASLGTVSAVGGPVHMHRGGILESYIRTDTISYPGFSGGPLINSKGQVLGINTSGLAQGAALTIPSHLAWAHGKTLAQHGRLRRGYLGVRSQPVELPAGAEQALGRTQKTGLLLVGVDRDSPAAKGGLMIGDILVAIAGIPIQNPDELVRQLNSDRVDQPTQMEILRGGQPAMVTVTIGERQ
jgi:S1-C subfamily serine protease